MNMPANGEDFNSLVTPALRTTSRIIAEKFEKQHGHVMRDIRAMIDANPEWGVSNFGETPYVDAQNGQTYQMYEITRDGYAMLVMGFTGKKAMDWKIQFLAAFNAMEAHLRAQSQAAMIDLNDPAQLVPLLTAYAQRTQIAEAKVIEMAPKAEALDRIATAEGSLNITETAKALQMRPKDLFAWLRANGWVYRRAGASQDLGYQDKVNAGLLEHKVATVLRPDGTEKITEQVRVTPKGMARLAQVACIDAHADACNDARHGTRSLLRN